MRLFAWRLPGSRRPGPHSTPPEGEDGFSYPNKRGFLRHQDRTPGSWTTDRVLFFLTILVATVFSFVSFVKLSSFRYGFDTAVFSNVLWRLAHGYDSVSMLTGFPHLADHPSLLLLFLVPVGRIAGPLLVHLLLALQAFSVATVAWSVWRFARIRGLSRPAAVVLYTVTILGAGAWFAATGEFHVSDLALGPIAAAAVNGWEGRTCRAVLWGAVAALARIEIAFGVVILGWLILRVASRRTGGGLIAVGVLASGAMLAIGILTEGGGASIAAHLGHLGESPGDVIRTLVQAPSAVVLPLADQDMWTALVFWFSSFAILPVVVGVKWLLPALPMVAIPILGSWQPADAYFEHYWHVLLVFGALAAVEGLLKLRLSSVVSALLLASSCIVVFAVFGPLRADVPDNWQIGPQRPDPSLSAVVQEIPPGESVSVPFPLVANLSLRPEIMFFPRPFSCTGTENLLPRLDATRSEGPPIVLVAYSDWPDRDDAVWSALELSYAHVDTVGRYLVMRLRDPVLAQSLMVSCDDGIALR